VGNNERLEATLSSKGQLVLPQTIRRKRQWSAGTRLIVVDTPEGVLLKAAPLFPATTLDEVYGCAGYTGPTRSLADMDAATLAEAKARDDRG
jgi:AbrB family looped-hinge helix DNA binding protein